MERDIKFLVRIKMTCGSTNFFVKETRLDKEASKN